MPFPPGIHFDGVEGGDLGQSKDGLQARLLLCWLLLDANDTPLRFWSDELVVDGFDRWIRLA